jgi:translation initiation factor IF-2
MENTIDTKKNRPPIVTVMGHVDHGKTSILDAIRDTRVQAKEYGGITQHIGAYQIEHNGTKITFIDTPGHAAFTQMRSRGGKAADIVVLVVASNEGVQPQTKEAISHTKASGAKIIVAFNKIDLPGSNIQKCKQELAQENVLLEDWGGDVIGVEVSAKTGKNLDKLLDAIITLSEVMDIQGNEDSELEATIIESKIDRKRGVTVSCIIRNGTLTVTDVVTASGYKAKIRSLTNDKGEMLKEAGPSTPVEILGFKKVPNVGDLIVYAGSELTELSIDEDKQEIIGKDAKKTVGIVLKADTQGTLEAVKASLAELISSSVGSSFAIKIVHSATGEVSESDIMLAESSNGLVLGFNVRIPPNVLDYANSQKVKVRSYKAIYELIDEAIDLLEGSAKTAEEKIKGRAQIIKLFKLPSGDVIAGCKVLAGALKINNRISIYDIDPADVTDDDIPLYTGSIKKLKKGKDDINIVGKDNECGVLLKPYFDGVAIHLWIEVL